MGNGGILEGDRHHLVARQFATAANGIGHFAGFAQGIAHATALVTHDHEGAEIEPASAFHHFGRTIDEDNLLHQFFGRSATKPAVGSITAGFTTTTAASAGTALVVATSFFNFCHSILLGSG